jgi:hypothetical protein
VWQLAIEQEIDFELRKTTGIVARLRSGWVMWPEVATV